MIKNKILFYKVKAGLHLGYLDFKGHFFVSWPFCELNCYKDKIIINIAKFEFFNPSTFKVRRYDMGKLGRIPKEIVLNLKDIKGYKKNGNSLLSLIKGKSIQLIHKNKKYPEGIKIWLYGKSFDRLIIFLKSKGKREI